MHVHGDRERGNINTPLELAIENEIDRFTPAMDVMKHVPRLQRIGSAALDKFQNDQISCKSYAFQHGTDRPDIVGWRWPSKKARTAA